MKKIICTILTLLITTSIQCFALGIEIQPTMYSRSNAQDRLWVGSFQLVWNDFMDKIVHNPIRFREGNPPLVNELNRQTFTYEDISEKSYYKYAGKVTKKTKRNIEKGIRKKFKESSDLLDKLDLTARNDMYIIYAMLKKDFEFINEFDKLGRSAFGEEDMVEYFGVNKNSSSTLRNGVKILFYNAPDDYAVMLKTKNNDEVYLYKNITNKSFNSIYRDLTKKTKAFNGNQELRKIDELKIPNISFFEEKSYDELANRRIMGTNLVINQALQTVKFNMNNKGVKLKSEAAMTTMTTSLLPPEELVPRLFYFDSTFVMFLKEKGKENPYFAMRVHDIKKFQTK